MKRLRVLSLATLYPNDLTPNFGIFVERQMQAVARRGDVDLVLVNPIGLPPFPLSLHPRYRRLAGLPKEEQRGGIRVLRPRFRLLPGIGGRFNAQAVARAVLPLARRLHAEAPFDLVDAQFFYPDGPAAVAVGAALGLPVSIKARGADIHHWGKAPGTAAQVLDAGLKATGLLAVAGGMADDMADLGIPRGKITIHRTGLDRSVFKPHDRAEARTRLGLPQDKPLLACVGALIPRNSTANLMTAAITSGSSLAAADLLNDLKSGYLLGANPRRQFLAQAAGILTGTIATTIGYFVLVPDATALTGTAGKDPAFPAPGAQQWKAVAEVMKYGFGNMHPMSLKAFKIALVVGVILALAEGLAPKKWKKYLPSPTGLGLGMTLPFFFPLAMFLGAVFALVAGRVNKSWAERYIVPIAAGGIAGESIVGVVVQALNNFVLH